MTPERLTCVPFARAHRGLRSRQIDGSGGPFVRCSPSDYSCCFGDAPLVDAGKPLVQDGSALNAHQMTKQIFATQPRCRIRCADPLDGYFDLWPKLGEHSIQALAR